MNVGKTLFAQLMEFIPWTSFARIVHPAADIEAQRVKVQDAVKDLKNMPVLAVGISYAF